MDDQDGQDEPRNEGRESCQFCPSVFYSLIAHEMSRIAFHFAHGMLTFPGEDSTERAGRLLPMAINLTDWCRAPSQWTARGSANLA
jgi:hypothetical protein